MVLSNAKAAGLFVLTAVAGYGINWMLTDYKHDSDAGSNADIASAPAVVKNAKAIKDTEDEVADLKLLFSSAITRLDATVKNQEAIYNALVTRALDTSAPRN